MRQTESNMLIFLQSEWRQVLASLTSKICISLALLISQTTPRLVSKNLATENTFIPFFNWDLASNSVRPRDVEYGNNCCFPRLIINASVDVLGHREPGNGIFLSVSFSSPCAFVSFHFFSFSCSCDCVCVSFSSPPQRIYRKYRSS